MNTQPLIAQLLACGEYLPDDLQGECVAAGNAIVPALITLIETDLATEPPGESWASLHAVVLLGELGDVRAAPILIRCLAECDSLLFIHEHASKVLTALGAAILDLCLEHYANSADDALRDDLAYVLSRLAINDERIFDLLSDTLARNPVAGANCFFYYGDRRALALLSDAYDAQPLKSGDSPFANDTFIELRAAIIDLGGQLTAAQTEKYEQAMRARERWVARVFGDPAPPPTSAQPLTQRRRKRGRNEPCWCGSGKKYKRCHGPLER